MWIAGGVILVFLSLIGGFYTNKITYDGHKVYQVAFNTTEQAEILSNLKGKEGYNFWTEIDMVNKIVDIMVAPKFQDEFTKLLKENNLEYTIFIEDYGKIVEKLQQDKTRQASKSLGIISQYMSYNDIISWVKRLSKIKLPNENKTIIQIEKIGKSYEKRDVYMMKISADHRKKKPIFLMEAGMHAREWAGPPTVLHIAKQLTENYTENKDLLEKIDFYIIPVTNPDGYEYTRNFDRMWRKTRSKQGSCFGVDGNRNFNDFWGVRGASDDPCSDIYKGPYPFSENETQNLRNVGIKYSTRLMSYMAVHSYGSYLLYPWGYTKELPEDADTLEACAKDFVEAVKKFSGRRYTYGSSSRVLYEAAGASDDWFKGKLNVPFAYTLELPGSQTEGFHVLEYKLPSLADETFAGIRSLVKCFLRFEASKNWPLGKDYDEDFSSDENDN